MKSKLLSGLTEVTLVVAVVAVVVVVVVVVVLEAAAVFVLLILLRVVTSDGFCSRTTPPPPRPPRQPPPPPPQDNPRQPLPDNPPTPRPTPPLPRTPNFRTQPQSLMGAGGVPIKQKTASTVPSVCGQSTTSLARKFQLVWLLEKVSLFFFFLFDGGVVSGSVVG